MRQGQIHYADYRCQSASFLLASPIQNAPVELVCPVVACVQSKYILLRYGYRIDCSRPDLFWHKRSARNNRILVYHYVGEPYMSITFLRLILILHGNISV